MSDPRPTILIVEDDDAVLKMVDKMLSPIAEIILASDGSDALAALEDDELPDLVVTDVMMPNVDGLTLAKKMKDDPRLSRIPVIMLTAKDRPLDVITGINAGARHYMTKPFKKEELVAKVRKVLKLRGG